MFSVELLVYLYIAVCVSMIGFNIFTILLRHRRDRRAERRSAWLLEQIRREADRLREDAAMDPALVRSLSRKFSRVEWLMAFDDAMTSLTAEDPAGAERFLAASQPMFIRLCLTYRKKEPVQQAYLAWVLSRYRLARNMEKGPIVDYMKSLLRSDSIYCRENALRAFYSFASPRSTVEAVTILDESHQFHHGKLLTDGLLTFQGDHAALTALLWERLDRFQVDTQVAVLNYIRFRTAGYEQRMLDLLTDPAREAEVRYCAIRYLGKYAYAPAAPILREMAADREDGRWEAAAISATALAAYPGQDTVDTLKSALRNPNWYVRYNAAASLEKLDVTYLELSDVMNGADRYAREMLQYFMDQRQARKEAAVCST